MVKSPVPVPLTVKPLTLVVDDNVPLSTCNVTELRLPSGSATEIALPLVKATVDPELMVTEPG